MAQYTDANGRTFQVAIDVAAMRRVKAATGKLIATLVTGESLLSEIEQDPTLLNDILYAICQPAAERAGVTAEQWAASFTGDALESGRNALVEAVIDFFPRQKAAILRATWVKLIAEQKRQVDLMSGGSSTSLAAPSV
jgi:hypothetical protein